MELWLYNTLTRSKERFEPAEPGRVTMYVCGPTVYSYAHIGNARPAVVFDVLARLLRHSYQLVYARNITDVDDKINAAAAAAGVPIGDITTRFAHAYLKDMRALGVEAPDLEPRVTDNLAPIIEMIARLIEVGHAYESEGHVLFDVSSFADYGRLSGRNRDDMIAGARVDVASYKRDPADFVLWKPSSAELPGWDSAWGRGRPGWHLECSAMIEAHLGRTIDIHGGGQDLVFPHHENEIAQSTCAHEGQLYVRYWLHNGFLNVDSDKMSKSLGNVLLVRDLLQQAPGEAIRLGLLGAHYRQPLDWTDGGLQESRRKLDRLYGALRDAGPPQAAAEQVAPEGFRAALNDDLNTPRAIAELFAMARQINKSDDPAEKCGLAGQLRAAGAVIGLLQQNPEEWFQSDQTAAISDTEIEALLVQRSSARTAGDYAAADRIRDQLAGLGVVIEDRSDDTRWRRGSA